MVKLFKGNQYIDQIHSFRKNILGSLFESWKYIGQYIGKLTKYWPIFWEVSKYWPIFWEVSKYWPIFWQIPKNWAIFWPNGNFLHGLILKMKVSNASLCHDLICLQWAAYLLTLYQSKKDTFPKWNRISESFPEAVRSSSSVEMTLMRNITGILESLLLMSMTISKILHSVSSRN